MLDGDSSLVNLFNAKVTNEATLKEFLGRYSLDLLVKLRIETKKIEKLEKQVRDMGGIPITERPEITEESTARDRSRSRSPRRGGRAAPDGVGKS